MSYLGEGEEARVSRAESWGAGGSLGVGRDQEKVGGRDPGRRGPRPREREEQKPERGRQRPRRREDSKAHVQK